MSAFALTSLPALRRWIHMGLLVLMLVQSVVPAAAQEAYVEPVPAEEQATPTTSEKQLESSTQATSVPPVATQPAAPEASLPLQMPAVRTPATDRQLEPCLELTRLYLPTVRKPGNGRSEPNGEPTLAATCLLDLNHNTRLELELDLITAPAALVSPTLSLQPSHGAATLAGNTLWYTPSADYTGSDELHYTFDTPQGLQQVQLKLSVEPGTATPVVPMINCVQHEGADAYTALWGYLNYSNQLVDRPVGALNYFAPGTADQGQPTTFQPGLTPDAVSVPFSATTPLMWVVGKRNLQIDHTTFPCTTDNTPPTVTPGQLLVPGNSTGTLDLATLAEDADNDPLSWSLSGAPLHGTAAIIESTLLYTPDQDYYGTDSVSYTVADSINAAVTGTVAVSVTNAPPLVTLQADPLSGTVPLTVTFTATASDPDGADAALTYRWVFGDGIEASTAVSATHVYTQTGLYAPYVIVTDASGAYASAMVQIRAGDVENTPPTANDEIIYLRNGITATLDLALTSNDVDRDPLTWSVAQSPQHGTATISGSLLVYTRTAAFTGSDSLVYEVADAVSATTATVQIVDQRIVLQITPSSLILPAANLTHTLEAKGYDYAGNPVSLDGIELEWLVSHSNWITGTSSLTFTTVPGEPHKIVVRSTAETGAATFATQSKADHAVRSNLATVLVARPQDNALLVPDAQVVFPPVGLAPTQGITDAYPLVNDEFIIGDFTLEEVLQAYEAITVTNEQGEEELLEARFAVVLDGVVPQPGQVLIANESAQIYGRVLHTEVRTTSTLVTLQLISFPETFRTLNYYINTERLEQDGVYKPEVVPLLAVLDEHGDAYIYERTPEALETLEGAYAPDPQRVTPNTSGAPPPAPTNDPWFRAGHWEKDKILGKCKTEANINWGGMSLKPNFALNPKIETGLVLGEFVDQHGNTQQYIESAKAALGMNPTVGLNAELKFQASGDFSLSCELFKKDFSLPLAASANPVLAALNAFLKPTVNVKVNFGFKGSFEGGPKLTLKWSISGNVDIMGGFQYENGNLSFVPPSKYDPKFTVTKPQAIIGGNIGADRWKAEVTVGLYVVGTFKFEILGSVFSLLKPLAGKRNIIARVLRTFASALTIDVLEAQLGGEVKTAWATPQYVLWDHVDSGGGKFKADHAAQMPFSIALKASKLKRVLKLFGLDNYVSLDLKLGPKDPLFKWKWFEALTPDKAWLEFENQRTDSVWQGDVLKIVAEPKENAEWPYYKGELYYVSDSIGVVTLPEAELQRQDNQLIGTWEIPEKVCKDKAPGTAVEFHLLGYSRMTAAQLPTASYIGSIDAVCESVRVDIILPAVIENASERRPDPHRPNDPELSEADWPTTIPVVYACDDPNDQYDQRDFTAQARAFDHSSYLEELDFTFGGRITKQGGQGISRLEAQLTHQFGSQNPEYHPVHATARVRREGTTIEKTVHRPFYMIFRRCDEVKDFDQRTLQTMCETINQERVRIGNLVSPPGGVPMLVFPPWNDQEHPWYTISRVPKNAACAWFVGGDPHIRTMDGLRFDSFSLGEFIYLAPRPGFETTGSTIQVRQQRVSGVAVGRTTLNTAEWTSWNTAIALQLDDLIFEFRAGELLRPFINREQQTLTPGVYSYGEVDLLINSASEVELRYRSQTFRLMDRWGAWLDIDSFVSQDDSHAGMAGRPNGNIEDDFQWPNGRQALDAYDLANAWRITTKADSLFTYAAEEGPWTYNLRQEEEPPSRQELAPFMEQAEALLNGVCQPGSLDEIEIRNVALELFVGRAPDEIARTGVCFYSIHGQITNELVPGLAVPGAKVTVSANNETLCEAWSDRFGNYTCLAPSTGSLAPLTLQVSQRGSATAPLTRTELPRAGGLLGLKQDLSVAPTTIRLSGHVHDQTDQPLYNAEVRVRGPEQAGFTTSYTTTNATGAYTTYMMLDDDVLAGDVTYQLLFSPDFDLSPDAQSIGSTFTRAFANLNEHALNILDADLQLTGVLLRFTGRVSFAFDEAIAVQGARVFIEPTQPHAEFESCDVTALIYVDPLALSATRKLDPRKETTDPARVGTYSCEVPLEDLSPFQATIKVLSRTSGAVIASETVTVDPAARPAGESFHVVTALQVNTPVLRLQGRVQGPRGEAVAGAAIAASADNAILTAVTHSDVTGIYTAFLPLDDSTSSGMINYNVTYLNVGTSGSEAFNGAVVGVPLVVNKDFTVRGSLLEFAGRVIDLRTRQPIYGASVHLSSPDDPSIDCAMQTGLHPITPDEYMLPPSPFDRPPLPKRCKVISRSNAPDRMRLVYDLQTPWGSDVFTQTYQTPALGGYGFVGQDLLTRSITPTMLELQGVVTRPSGAPLAGALVKINAGGATTRVRTTETGAYTAPLILPAGVLSGSVEYTVRYRTLTVTEALPFSATQYETTVITNDLLYTPRTVYFRGSITNTYGIDLPPTTVEISSTDLIVSGGAACVTQTDLDGSYVCAAQTNAPGDITLTYRAAGLWGAEVFTETVSIPANADIVEHVKELAVDLTVVHATGRVTTPAGEPLQGVELTPSGNDVFRVETHTTNADGFYDFYVLLRPRATSPWRGQLHYFVGYGTEGRIFLVDYDGIVDQATSVQRDFSLNMRVVAFEGEITNAFVPISRQDKGVYGSQVQISSPQIGPLCTFASLERYRDNKYTCQARVFTAQPFDYVYTVSGEWGSVAFTDTLSSVPEPGELLKLERDFVVQPTTIKLMGLVTDRDGQPLRDIELTIDSPAFITRLQGEQLVRELRIRTDDQGRYIAYVVVNGAATTANLSYNLEYRFDNTAYTINDTVQTTLHPGQLNTLNKTWSFQYRKVTFTGRLRNTTDAEVPLEGSLLIVSPSLNRTLCAGVSASTSRDYSCEALIDTDSEYLATYRVTGVWGTTNLLNQPISGTLATVATNIDVQPRVLRLQGNIVTPNGTALANASVRVTSYSIINERFTDLRATSAADGSYSVASVLGAGVSRVVLRYEVELHGNTAVHEQTFSINPGDSIATINHDLVIASSRLTFQGSLWNSLTNSSGGWSRNNQIVVASPTLGQLCTARLSSSFECTATLTTQQPFDVTYTIFADWGSTVITDRITTLPAFGQHAVVTPTLAVTPTMVRITGTALVTDGLALHPLAEASVRTALPGRVSSPLVSSVWNAPNTAVSGTFDLLVMLTDVQNATTGTLSLVFQNSRGTFVDQHVFNVSEGVLNQSDAGTLIFEDYPDGSTPANGRTVILRGTFINALAPDAPTAQPKAYYRLESPTLGTICAYDNPRNPPVGGYYCPVTLYTAEPFEVVVYTWGPYGGAVERQYEVTTLPPVGGSTTVQENILFTPTTVHASGIVFEPGMVPVPLDGIEVTVRIKQGEKDVARVQQRTQANGAFDLYTILPAAVTGPVDVFYELDLDGIKSKLALTNRQVQPAQINEWSYMLPFEKRRVRFAGRVTNELVPGLGVPGQVFITAPDYTTQFCDADVNPTTGFYSCDAVLQSSQPISVNYRINGLWGTHDITGTVTQIAGVGSTTLVERDVQVSPTTVRFFGTVTDSYGKPLGNARITVADENGGVFAGQTGGGQDVEAVSNAAGHYETFVLLRPNITRGDLLYSLEYYNVTREYSSTLFGMLANQLNEQRLDFELDFRNVVFNGRVRNAFNPALGMLGTIALSSTAQTLCTTELDDGSDKPNPDVYVGEYSCTARGVSMESFAVEYAVAGDWGAAAPVTDTVPFGQAGSEASFLKNIAVTPTTLRLVGVLQDGLGNPLAGATVRVAGDQLSGVNTQAVVSADAQGWYTATVVLKQNVTTGTLSYRVTVNNGSASLAVPFTATLNNLETITTSITFEERQVAFTGTIINALHNNAPLQGVNVAVEDAAGATFCQVTSAAAGAYACSARLLDNNSVGVRYRLSGDWGTSVFSSTIPAGASNVTTNVSRTWAINPTMLRMQGIVRDTNGVPLANATISVSGPAVSTLSGIVAMQTDAQGRYNGVVILRQGFTADSLTYRVRVGASEATVAVPFTAMPNQITPLTKDILFTVRTVNFSGTVFNYHAPGQPVRSATVAIHTASGSSLCFPTTNSAGQYNCSVQVVDGDAIPIVYTISGDWGSTTVNGSVPAGVSGVAVDVARTLHARPTTLALRGTIRDANGVPLHNALLAVSGQTLSNLNAAPLLATDAAGVYSATIVLKADATAASLRYRVNALGNQGDLLVPYNVAAQQAASVTRDITFAPRSLQFSGRVVNTVVPSMTIPSTTIDVQATTGSLCSTTSTSSGEYSCFFQSAENTGFPIEYALSGTWGTAMLTGTVPTSPLSSTTQPITRDLPITLTTLRLQGRVLDGSTGIEAVTVNVSSADAVAAVAARTDADGQYAAFVGLKSGTTQTSLAYQVRAGYGVDNRTVALNNIVDRGLTTFDQNFYFTQRPITFTIQPTNAWSGQPVKVDAMTISTSNTGPLCSLENSGQTSFTCSALIVSNQNFIVSYAMTGTWGSWTQNEWVNPGTSNNPILVDRTIATRPTTMRVYGTVSDPNGNSRRDAVITATSPLFDQPFVATTNSSGNYNLYPYVADQATSGAMTLTAALDGVVQTRVVTWTDIAAQNLSNLPRQDWSLGLYPPTLVTNPTTITQVLSAGTALSRTLVISNAGQLDLSYQAYELETTPWFEMPYESGTLSPAQAVSFTVLLDATNLVSGTYEGFIRLDTNDPVRRYHDLAVNLQVLGEAQTVLSPTALLFGDVFVGGRMTQTLILSNTGTSEITLDAVSVTGAGYVTDWLAGTVAPGAARLIEVALLPTRVAEYPATLALTTSVGTYAVPLSGAGVLPPVINLAPARLDVQAAVDDRVTRTLTISNTGSALLEWTFNSYGSYGSEPDAFGYRWIDNTVPHGPHFEWHDISASGTSVNSLSDDNYAGAFPIGFEFEFYGQTYTQFYIASNGYIGFGPPDGYGTLGQQSLPDANQPNNLIAWSWADLYPRGPVYYQTTPAGLLVQFKNYGLYGNSGPRIDAQVLLSRYNTIQIRYNRVDAGWYPHSIGIENQDGSIGSQVAHNAVYAQTGRVIEFSARPGWLEVQPVSGTTAPNTARVVDVVFDATDLISNTYAATLTVVNNDPLQPFIDVPVTFAVAGTPTLAFNPEILDAGTLFVGQAVTKTLVITNSGSAEVQLSNVAVSDPVWTPFFTPTLLVPGQAFSMPVRFSSSTAGQFAADLSFTSAAGASWSTALSATVLLPPIIDVTPPSLAATVASGQLTTRTLTINNTGASQLVWSSPTLLETDLQRALANLNRDAASVTALIPQRYDFSEGTSNVTINDGGANMFDGGNYLYTDLESYLQYTDNTIIPSTAFGTNGAYFTRKYAGLFVLGATLDGNDSFTISGNLGADGYGTVDTQVLTTTINGIQYTGFVKRVYNTYTPSVNHLVIVRSAPGMAHEAATSTDSDYHVIHGLGNSSQLFYLLYAGSDGAYVDDQATLAIMRQFITLADHTDWLRGSPAAGTVDTNSDQLAIVFDATNTMAGTYTSTLVLASNDPATPVVSLPLTLTVTGAAALELESSLTMSDLFVGASTTTTLALTNTGTANLTITTIASSHSAWSVPLSPTLLTPGAAAHVPLVWSPVAAGVQTTTLSVQSSLGITTTTVSGRALAPPAITIQPTTFNISLAAGAQLTRSLSVSNTGTAALEYALELEAPRNGRLNVAVLGADSATNLNDVTTKLQATGIFNSVTSINSNQRTPTLAELQAYQAVLVYANYSLADGVALGDVLADYVDAGGGVVLMQFALRSNNSLRIRGRFEAQNYYALQPGGDIYYPTRLGQAYQSDHPLLLGVETFNTGSNGGYRSNGPLAAESVRIVDYRDGTPLAVEKQISTSLGLRPRLDLNFYPVSSTVDNSYWDAATDGALLMANALVYVARPTWVTLSASGGTLSANLSQTVAVHFNASSLSPGTYRAQLVVRSTGCSF